MMAVRGVRMAELGDSAGEGNQFRDRTRCWPERIECLNEALRAGPGELEAANAQAERAVVAGDGFHAVEGEQRPRHSLHGAAIRGCAPFDSGIQIPVIGEINRRLQAIGAIGPGLIIAPPSR